ncbi:MAG: hypothetical protein A2X86_14455 [Bdellovibrionales bacterium GWA2_49_15]|nr:MAG: hypothetical protein A2X86_14455 [Bdellovibrionales bacterium GWA2_49_15]HAZ13830.1 hypothetical protein [Bdellovibrionales bacterium]
MLLDLKKIICLSSLISATVFAQGVGKMEEMAPSGEYVSGGYGAPFTKISRIGDTDGIFTGIKGAWIVNHQYALGLAAYTLVNNVPVPGYQEPLQYGVVGANFEYIYPVATDFSIASSVLLGGGFDDFNDNPDSADGLFIAEPEINFLYSVTKNFKIGVNGSYRAVADSDLAGVSNHKLSGFTYGLGLNFGSF